MKHLLVALAVPAALALGVGSVAAFAAKPSPAKVVTHQVTAAVHQPVAGSAHKAAVVSQPKTVARPKTVAQPKAVAQPVESAAPEADAPGGHQDPTGVDVNNEFPVGGQGEGDG